MIADDLFAGAGGWDLAAEELGIHARGVENMAEALATREAAEMETIHHDVWTFNPDGQAELEIASPPCQTFSKAGKGSGRKALDAVTAVLHSPAIFDMAQLRQAAKTFGDERTGLVLTPLHFALTRDQYRSLAWEQVPAVLPVWEECAERLRPYGWNVWTGMLNSEQYGVPQTRKRAVLIASRDRQVGPPRITHSLYHTRTPSRLDDGVAPWVSMAEALGWPHPEHPSPMDRCHCTEDVTLHTPLHDRAYDASIPRGPGQPAPTLSFGHAAAQWRWCPRAKTPDGLARFAQQSDNTPDYGWPDQRPPTTVAGRDLVQAPGATANRFNSSTKSRNDGVRVSVAEAGVLQSFPEHFPWRGKAGKQYLQAGNAVPVAMARAILTQLAGPPPPEAVMSALF